MKRLVGIATVALLCGSLAGCAGVQRSVVTSQTDYEIVYRACVDAFDDIRYLLSASDLANGLIVARPALTGDAAYTKMTIVVARSGDGVTLSVEYAPGSATTRDGGAVDAYFKALKKRVPDIVVTRAR